MSNIKRELFTSRFGFIAATLGMAIGAGNIWRFPRLAGQYGGSFLITWLIFLLLWSIPLLIAEYAVGRKERTGVIGAFKRTMGEKFVWMGWFVAFCTSAIMFYYSVVCGWALKYFSVAASGQLTEIDHSAFWVSFTSGAQPAFFMILALLVGAGFIYLGIVKGVERFSKIIIPTLYGLMIISAFKALSLEGAGLGLDYFFSFDSHSLWDYKIWLEGLSQSAWSTGAGWGLILTYAVYSRSKESIIGNVFLTGIGNNLASLLAGLVIIPTVFALSATTQQANELLAVGNQGLAFIAIPELFSKMVGGNLFGTIFFLSLFFAALSSLLAMIELASCVLIDFGINRKKAVVIVVIVAVVLGLPSALSLDIFNNQDWVWGVGLIVSGFMFNLLVIKIGPVRFVKEWLQPQKNEAFIAFSFKILFYIVIPLEFVVMLGWWLYQAATTFSVSAWDPFETYSLGTTLLQWAIILLVGFALNKKMSKLLERGA